MATTYPYDTNRNTGITINSLGTASLNSALNPAFLSESTALFPVTSTSPSLQYSMGDLANMYAGTNPSLAQALGASNTGLSGGFTDFTNPQMSFTDKLSTGVNLFNAGFNAWNGYQAQKLAKQQFNFQKDAWNKQYEANKGITNSQLEDRQARRNRTDTSGREVSVADYMAKYGVK